MKIPKQSSKKTKVLIAGLIAGVLAIAGYGVTAYYKELPPFNTTDSSAKKEAKENDVNTEPATDKEKQAGLDAKKDFIERQDENQDGEQADPVEGDTNNSTRANVTITSASQTESVLQVRSIIDGNDNNGSCKLTLSKTGQQSIVQQSATAVMRTYTICEGFDVDISSISKGEWNIVIEYIGSLGAGSASSKVDIK